MLNKDAENFTVSFGKANVGALLTTLPICVAFLSLYVGLYGWNAVLLPSLSIADILILLALLVLGIIAHEGMHAFSWSWLDGISRQHIHFGFQWSTLTPYVHCDVPITARNYRWGTALPGILLGILPAVAAIIFRDVWLFYFGLVFTLAAGGDFLILWLLRKVDGNALVQDHPDLIGCQIVNPNEHS